MFLRLCFCAMRMYHYYYSRFLCQLEQEVGFKAVIIWVYFIEGFWCSYDDYDQDDNDVRDDKH